MAGTVKTTSPFGSEVEVSTEVADRLASFGYEAEKKTTTRASSTKTADKSSDGK